MKFTSKSYEYFAYGLLILLGVIIMICCLSFKYTGMERLEFNKHVNINSNAKIENFVGKEGYAPNNENKTLFKTIENKLNGLTSELGGPEGKNEIKKILRDTKKISNLECAKCLIEMLDENKSEKTINLDRMLEDDLNENCVKCKRYTELSNSLQAVLDNL